MNKITKLTMTLNVSFICSSGHTENTSAETTETVAPGRK